MKYFKNRKSYTLVFLGVFVIIGSFVLSACNKKVENNKDNNIVASISK